MSFVAKKQNKTAHFCSHFQYFECVHKHVLAVRTIGSLKTKKFSVGRWTIHTLSQHHVGKVAEVGAMVFQRRELTLVTASRLTYSTTRYGGTFQAGSNAAVRVRSAYDMMSSVPSVCIFASKTKKEQKKKEKKRKWQLKKQQQSSLPVSAKQKFTICHTADYLVIEDYTAVKYKTHLYKKDLATSGVKY